MMDLLSNEVLESQVEAYTSWDGLDAYRYWDPENICWFKTVPTNIFYGIGPDAQMVFKVLSTPPEVEAPSSRDKELEIVDVLRAQVRKLENDCKSVKGQRAKTYETLSKVCDQRDAFKTENEELKQSRDEWMDYAGKLHLENQKLTEQLATQTKPSVWTEFEPVDYLFGFLIFGSFILQLFTTVIAYVW